MWTRPTPGRPRRGFDAVLRHAHRAAAASTARTRSRAATRTSSARRRAEASSTPTRSRDEAGVRPSTTRAQARIEPFFLYVAYTAPHWPLHAHARGHRAVPRALRRRLGRAARAGGSSGSSRSGIIAGSTDAERPGPEPAGVARRPTSGVAARRMQVVRGADRPDGPGHRPHRRARSTETGALDAHAFLLPVRQRRQRRRRCRSADVETFRRRARASCRPRPGPGRELRIGNTPDIEPGRRTPTQATDGRGRTCRTRRSASTSAGCTRGGISTPLIAHWPDGGIEPRILRRAPFQLTDVVPTVLEAAGCHVPGDVPRPRSVAARGPQHAARL